MRKFNDKEKEYIRLLCENTRDPGDVYLPINLLDSTLRYYRVTYTTGSEELVFYRDIDNLDSRELIAIESSILELATLLDYLEKSGLILFVEDLLENPRFTVGEIIHGLTPIEKRVAPIVYQQLTKASSFRVFVGETLRDLVANDFRTYEDQTLEEARKQTNAAKHTIYVSWGTLFVAILTMLLTICLSRRGTQHVIVDECCHPKSCDTKHCTAQPPTSKDSAAFRRTIPVSADPDRLLGHGNNVK